MNADKITWLPPGEYPEPKTALSDPHSVGFHEVEDDEEEGDGMPPEQVAAFMARPIEPKE